MKKIKDIIKYALALLIRAFWKISGIFLPIKKNLIVFDSFVGKQYSCNPRAIYEYLCKNADSDTEFVWAFREPDKFRFLEKKPNTKIVKYHSFIHQYYFYRAGTIVFNWKKTYDLPTRKGQLIIQTWHGGGCYKKAGNEIKENSRLHTAIMQKETNTATHYISSSKYFSENVIRKQQGFKGKIISTGMPRNDVLVVQDRAKAGKIRKNLGIPADSFVIMYAPTYRDSIIDQNFDSLDFQEVSEAVKKRFGKEVIFIYRGHHYNTSSSSAENVIDMTDYFDMQDLLLISDMLISDYSSSIWDYSFTYRPCFLYTPDLEKYIEGRGLDEDIYTWGFPVSLSNDELKKQILEFDGKSHIKNMKKHHDKLGSFEKGTASERIGRFIIKRMRRKK